LTVDRLDELTINLMNR